MRLNKKESRLIYMSVEGVNCERLYFEHLKKLINSSGQNKFNLAVTPRVATPLEFAKRNAYKIKDKSIPFIHVQDIEDYNSKEHRDKFFTVIDDIRSVEERLGIEYRLGYSNYSFELWMLLHVTYMHYTVKDRYAYLAPINQHFHKHYRCLDDFKRQEEFQSILDTYVTLDSIKNAVNRANQIVVSNREQGKVHEQYRGFNFFHENPDLSVHEVVSMIFEICGIKL